MALKGITRAALVKIAGVSATTITAVQKSKMVKLETAQAISKALDSDVDTLFTVVKDTSTLSAKIILEHHRLISTILSQAEKEMLVPYNAAAKATPPKVEHKTSNYFQSLDVSLILEELEHAPIKWRTITHLLLVTGCRRGEIAGLKWSKIDFTNNRLLIDCALLYSPEIGIYEDTTKNRKARFVKVPAETMQMLHEYRRWYLELKLKNGDRWTDTDYLFVKDDGNPMIPDGITAWLSNFSERRGLPHVNPQAFRHTSASILIKNGQDIASVSKRLGHSKITTTLEFYTQLIEEADTEASESLADTLLRPKSN